MPRCFFIHLHPEDIPTDLHPSTTFKSAPESDIWAARWAQGTSGPKLRGVNIYAGTKSWTGWKECLPWEGKGKKPSPILVNLDAVNAARADWGRVAEVGVASEAMRRGVQGALQELRAAYKARVEAEAHQRFLEDFGDETLWESHRATLGFAMPDGFSSGMSFRHHRSTVADALNDLVDHHLPITGTVAQVLERARTIEGLADSYKEVSPKLLDLVISDTSASGDKV